jgi:hypothetical protein
MFGVGTVESLSRASQGSLISGPCERRAGSHWRTNFLPDSIFSAGHPCLTPALPPHRWSREASTFVSHPTVWKGQCRRRVFTLAASVPSLSQHSQFRGFALNSLLALVWGGGGLGTKTSLSLCCISHVETKAPTRKQTANAVSAHMELGLPWPQNQVLILIDNHSVTSEACGTVHTSKREENSSLIYLVLGL